MIRTYKYRLYPTKAQARSLDFLLWQGRNLYNAALEQRKAVYEKTGKGINYSAQWQHFRDVRHANPDTVGQLNATSVQQLLRRLDKAFGAFFRRLKAGETPGFPRFKGRHRFKSIEYRYGDGCKLRWQTKPDNTQRPMCYVQNVGEIKVKYHRPLPDGVDPARPGRESGWGIKHVVLKRQGRKWFVCLMLELPDPEPAPEPQRPAVGIDMGLHSLLAFSNGDLLDNPRWLREAQAKLRRAQRKLNRRKKGSNRRRKAAMLVAQQHERIANQRRDFWHKHTRELTNRFGVIALEDLNLSFMTRNHHLALSAHDASLGEFQQLLAYKAEEAGTAVVTVNPANTSQMCSGCGAIVKKSLSVRVHRCPHCGLELDRDVNAAQNVLNRARSAYPALFENLDPARTERSGHNVGRWVKRALRSSP